MNKHRLLQYQAVSSILFAIVNLVFLAAYYSSSYSAPYFLAAPRAIQREKNDKERRYEGKARPCRCLFWLSPLEDGVKIWKSAHKGLV